MASTYFAWPLVLAPRSGGFGRGPYFHVSSLNGMCHRSVSERWRPCAARCPPCWKRWLPHSRPAVSPLPRGPSRKERPGKSESEVHAAVAGPGGPGGDQRCATDDRGSKVVSPVRDHLEALPRDRRRRETCFPTTSCKARKWRLQPSSGSCKRTVVCREAL